MKYDALVMVNNQNKETRRKMEERKIKNRIKKLVRKVGLSKWQWEQLEKEMDQEEIKELEGENAESEKSDKNNIPDNNDSSDTVGSD